MDTLRARKTTLLARKLRLRRRFARAGAALQAEVARIAGDLEAEADARLQARLEAGADALHARLEAARLEAEVFEALEAAGEAWNARKITTFSGGVWVGERPPEVFRGVYVLEMRETAAKGE
jgi:hypothetical protein